MPVDIARITREAKKLTSLRDDAKEALAELDAEGRERKAEVDRDAQARKQAINEETEQKKTAIFEAFPDLRTVRRAGGRAAPRRATLDAEARKTAILEVLAASPDGINGKALADRIGASTAAVSKDLAELVEAGTVRSEGEKRARKLYLA